MSQRDDIQGLRAIAVLLVIIFHANKAWLPGGFVGVDVFFVISGYIITSLVLVRRSSGRFSFLSFYLARIRRIVPAYILTLLVVLAAMSFLLIPKDFSAFRDSLFSALYFNSNNYFANQSDYFAPDSYELPLLHMWSLAIEMQFYLFLPALLVFTPQRYLPWVISSLISGGLLYSVWRLAQGDNSSVYFSLLARIPEFLAGSLLAILTVGQNAAPRLKNVFSIAGIIMVVASAFLINEADDFPGLLAVPVAIGVVFIIYARHGFVNSILSLPLFVWVGGLSYSLYLWHWPVFASARYFQGAYDLPVGVVVAALVLTAVLSCASYYGVEKPFRIGRIEGKAKWLLVGGACA